MPTTWAITPTRLPLLVRRCHRCRAERFLADGAFRVNANGKLLDAWLLALCTTCEVTLKLPVLERVHVRSVPGRLLDRLHGNDPQLVRELLHDPAVVQRLGVALDWTGAWRLETPPPPEELHDDFVEVDVVEVQVRFGAHVPVRPVRLIAEALGLSRAAVERLIGDGRIVASVDLRGRRSGDFSFLLKK